MSHLFQPDHHFWGHLAPLVNSGVWADTSHLDLHIWGLPAIHSSSVKTLRSNRSSNLVEKSRESNPNCMDTLFFRWKKQIYIYIYYKTHNNAGYWCIIISYMSELHDLNDLSYYPVIFLKKSSAFPLKSTHLAEQSNSDIHGHGGYNTWLLEHRSW